MSKGKRVKNIKDTESEEVKSGKVKKSLCFTICFILLAIVYTVLVKVVDVKQIGPNGSSVGFGSVNEVFLNSIGYNSFWYDVSEMLGYAGLATAGVYGLIGLYQLIQRKSLKKVDKQILSLGAFYVVVLAVYVFFEKVIINYRPVLENGVLEASYPSSHTLMTVCFCGAGIIVNKALFGKNTTTFLTNIVLSLIAIATVVSRLLSGVHWFSDIVGGLVISTALLSLFYTVGLLIKKKDKE